MNGEGKGSCDRGISLATGRHFKSGADGVVSLHSRGNLFFLPPTAYLGRKGGVRHEAHDEHLWRLGAWLVLRKESSGQLYRSSQRRDSGDDRDGEGILIEGAEPAELRRTMLSTFHAASSVHGFFFLWASNCSATSGQPCLASPWRFPTPPPPPFSSDIEVRLVIEEMNDNAVLSRMARESTLP